MSTPLRRLDNEDVRAIFECLHDGKPPPNDLAFRIVPVGSNGLKLSPPSFGFEGTSSVRRSFNDCYLVSIHLTYRFLSKTAFTFC